MIKVIKRTFYSIIFLSLVLFAFLISPGGLKLSISLVERLLPGKLGYQTVSGSLVGPIDMEGLSYQLKNFSIRIKHIHLVWRLPMLLVGDLAVDNLHAEKIDIHSNAPKISFHQNDSLNYLPINLKLGNVSLEHISYKTNDGSATIIPVIKTEKLAISSHHVSGKIIANMRKPYSINNTITLEGKPTHYHFTWKIGISANELLMRGQGNLKKVKIDIKETLPDLGQIDSNINLNWKDSFSWNANINMHNISLNKLFPSMPMIKQLSLVSSGEWKEKNPVFSIDSKVTAAGASITISGQHKSDWDLSWQASIKDLQQLYHPFSGKIISHGSIIGQNNNPTIEAVLVGSGINVSRLNATLIKVNTRLDLSHSVANYLRINASNLSFHGMNVKNLDFFTVASPNLKHVEIVNRLTQSGGKKTFANTVFEGLLTHGQWSGQLKDFLYKDSEYTQWKLKKPSRIELSTTSFSFNQSCVDSNVGSICFSADWKTKEPWQIQLTGNLLTLDAISHSIDSRLNFDVPASFSAQVLGVSKRLQGLNINLQTKTGKVIYQRDFKQHSLSVNKLNLILKSDRKSLRMTSEINLLSGNDLQSTVTFPEFFTQKKVEKQLISGTLAGHITDFKMLQALVPSVGEIKGAFNSELSLKGTVSNPELTGKIKLDNGHIEIPQLNLVFSDINLDMKARKKRIDYRLYAKSLDKPITVEGSTDFSNKKFVTTANISGKKIPVINTHEYSFYVSPKLSLKGVGKNIQIKGKLVIPEARIAVADISNTITLSKDTVFIGQEKDSLAPYWNKTINIDLILGNDVLIASHGLYGKLIGKLHLSSEKSSLYPVANGQLRLKDASFTTRGKKLSVSSSSSVNYLRDPIMNPHLSLSATRSVTLVAGSSPVNTLSKADVGVSITGTVEKPNVSLFSSPNTLSQTDILSYMLFDQPASIGGANSNLSILISAVGNLNFGKNDSNSSIDKVKQKLGITELGVQQQTYIDALGTPLGINQSSFFIGKHLSSKIYLRYIHALLTPVDIYQARYLFNKNWSFQAEVTSQQSEGVAPVTSIGSGADILYSISRRKFP